MRKYCIITKNTKYLNVKFCNFQIESCRSKNILNFDYLLKHYNINARVCSVNCQLICLLFVPLTPQSLRSLKTKVIINRGHSSLFFFDKYGIYFHRVVRKNISRVAQRNVMNFIPRDENKSRIYRKNMFKACCSLFQYSV